MGGPQQWDEHDFVFVGGMHRSGTTLLANAIGSASTASGLTGTEVRMDEGQFLQDVYPIGRALGGVTRWAFDDRAYLDEADAAAIPDAAARLWASWSPYWDLSARYLVEKTPLNLTKTRFLQAVYPNSKFVIITRHPITQSLAVRKWSPKKSRKFGYAFPTLVEHWLRAHEALRRDTPSLRAVHIVRYEDLMARPDREMERLADFLGFPVGVGDAAAVDGSRAQQYVREWQDTVHNGGVGPALRQLGAVRARPRTARNALKRSTELAWFPRYAKTLAREHGARIRSFGYDLDDLSRVEPWQ